MVVKLQAPTPKLHPEGVRDRLQTSTPSYRTRRFGAWSLVFLWSLEFGVWSFATVPAQPSPPPPPQDPLMSLMISQPRIELNGPVNPPARVAAPAAPRGGLDLPRQDGGAGQEG